MLSGKLEDRVVGTEEEIRQVAIDHHHIVVNKFESWYNDLASSRFSNAFTYGRSKIDRMVDELFESMPRGGKFLDVGCGTGEHLKRAMDHGLKAYGVEPAPAMREAARRNVSGAVVEDGVATKLPFPDAQFDVVIMIEVLRYLHHSDVEKALSEARRVLKPGGTLLVTLVNRLALDGFYLFQRGRQMLSRDKYNEIHPYCLFFTPAEARRDLRKAGFVNVRTEGRLLAPLRIAYKISDSFGGSLASALESVDDRLHRMKWTHPFAGHLIAIGEVPAKASGKVRKPRGTKKPS